MKNLEIKNYLSFKDVSINLNELNIFIGENNSGKTSLMKLISSVAKNDSLTFYGTWLKDVVFDKIVCNPSKPIEFYYSFNQHNNKSLFEKIKIETIGDYLKPLITEIITFNRDGDLVKFVVEYNKDSVKKEVIKIINVSMYVKKSDLFTVDKLPESNCISMLEEEFNGIDVKYSIDLEGDYNLLNSKLNDDETSIEERLLIIMKLNLNNKGDLGLKLNDLYGLYLAFDLKKFKIDSQCLEKENIAKNKKEFENVFDIIVSGRARFSEVYNDFVYINPLRKMFKEFYVEDKYNDFNLLEHDDCLYSLKMMNENKEIMDGVVDYFKSVSDLVEISLESEFVAPMSKKIYIPKYSIKGSKDKYNLAFSGTGISQVLPIVFQLINLIYKKTYKSLCIEQPEVHLHSRAQLELGNLIYKCVLESENKLGNENIIIETHSNFFMDSFRKASFENNCKGSEKLKFFFFNKKTNNTYIDEFWMENNKLSGNYENYLSFFQNHSIEMLVI